VLLRLRELTTLTDYFLIVSARSGRQVRAVAEAVVEDAEKHGIEKLSSEGVSRTHWALIDYGDVIVHIFHRPAREFYDLEGLWAEAPKEELTGDLAGEIQKAAQSNEADEWEEF
jgi:ribosome-associated protein